MEGEAVEEDGEGVSEPHGERSFLGKNKRTRAFIIGAGPVMNFLLAIIIYVVLTGLVGVAVFTTKERRFETGTTSLICSRRTSVGKWTFWWKAVGSSRTLV